MKQAFKNLSRQIKNTTLLLVLLFSMANVENAQAYCVVPPGVLTNTDATFATLLAGGSVTVGGVTITATKVNRAVAFTTDGYLQSGVHLNSGFDVTTSSITINFSTPISYFSTTFDAQQSEERITFNRAASCTDVYMNSTYNMNGNLPILSDVTLYDSGTRLRSNLSGPGGLSPGAFGSNSRVHWFFATPVSSITITNQGTADCNGTGYCYDYWNATPVPNPYVGTNYNGTIVGGCIQVCQSLYSAYTYSHSYPMFGKQ